MNQAVVTLTALQAGEVAHKLTIVRDEPDLLESYELDAGEVSELADAALAIQAGGTLSFDPKFADVLDGELENCLDIAGANLENSVGHDAAEIRGYLSSIHGARRKIAAAVAKVAP